MVGFFTGANADCSVWDLKAMDVQTTNAPEHGTVECWGYMQALQDVSTLSGSERQQASRRMLAGERDVTGLSTLVRRLCTLTPDRTA